MDLTKILSISGKPGLQRMIAQTKTGMVVESLVDGKRFTAFAHQRISSLGEISIYTYGEDMPLKEVFARMYRHLQGQAAPDPRDPGFDLNAFFEEVIEEYDRERVYGSDIRKMISWYNLLLEHGLVDGEEEMEAVEEENGSITDPEETSGPDEEARS